MIIYQNILINLLIMNLLLLWRKTWIKASLGDNVWQDIVQLTYNVSKYSIDNSPKTVIKDNYSRELGINPINNRVIDVYIVSQ